ncbi:MAG: type II TA system antitoxin MqsA family protein [Vicinamibacterales bacterium]
MSKALAIQSCLNCGATMTARREAVQLIGLPSVTAHEAAVWSCPACGAREVAFDRIDNLHRAVASALVLKRHALASEEIRFLRGLVGLSSEDLARELAVTPATWSRWENGRQPMSLTSERLLRFVVHTHLELLPQYPAGILAPLTATRTPMRMAFWFNGETWETTVVSDEVRRARRRPRTAASA